MAVVAKMLATKRDKNLKATGNLLIWVQNLRNRSRIDEHDTRSPNLRSKSPEKGLKGPEWAD